MEKARVSSQHGLQYKNLSREQFHDGLEDDFPCVTSLVTINDYKDGVVPWHWHKEVELFYLVDGILEYDLPDGSMCFPKGSGGLVNANVLHMTRSLAAGTVQRLHIFDPVLIGGWPGSRIEGKYVAPIMTAPQIDIIPLFPDDSKQGEILRHIKESFSLSEGDTAYEIKLRELLSRIWCEILELIRPLLPQRTAVDKGSDKLKADMVYIHEHYTEKLSVGQIASAAFMSERECFRVFQRSLHTTPADYVKAYRLQKACQMLAQGKASITAVGSACGFGSSSHFGEIFRRAMGCTPQEYRRMAGS